MVFGLFKRHGQTSTEKVPYVRKRTLQKVIRGKINLDILIHSNGWRGDHGFVGVGNARPFQVQHGLHVPANVSFHINSIEPLWVYVKLNERHLKT